MKIHKAGFTITNQICNGDEIFSIRLHLNSTNYCLSERRSKKIPNFKSGFKDVNDCAYCIKMYLIFYISLMFSLS